MTNTKTKTKTKRKSKRKRNRNTKTRTKTKTHTRTKTKKLRHVVNDTHMRSNGQNKEIERNKDTYTDNDNDEQIEACSKCHTYEMVKEEIQRLKINGQRQRGR